MEKKIAKRFYRLPRFVMPFRYKIALRPDMESATFTGEEIIFCNIKQKVKSITLHAKDLEIPTAEFLYGKEEAWTSKITYNGKAETVTLIFPKPLPKGKGKFKLTFRGILNDKLRGYYRSTYEHAGQTKYLATTQFEATDARRAFPCFDEPNIKAVFDVTLVVPSHHEVISNTLPVAVREHEAGLKAVTFSSTPKMSTYLLAFISGELEFLEGKTKNGVRVRVFTVHGKTRQAKFALGVAVKTLDYFQKYFEIKYPLPSLDLIAIPDFAAGAMENWGAITFRESALLIDPGLSSAASKQWVAMVVAHELAHQWFGNLVTMDWWTHLWLNEGFASFIEYVALDRLFPKWNIWTQFLSLDYAAGLEKDSFSQSHPIEVDVNDPNEIDEIFDDVSYRKGSSIIRQLAEYLGKEPFRQGLVHYLKRHSYKNATTKDLWIALEKVSGKPVQKIMAVWTKQEGYPVIRVISTPQGRILHQQRFVRSCVERVQLSHAVRWPVPISYLNGKGRIQNILMAGKTATLPPAGSINQTKLNIGETGFYRVAYEPEVLKSFIPLIEKNELATIDRWGIVSNIWALAESGLVKTKTALEISLAYRAEDDFTVLSGSLAGVLKLAQFYTGQKWYPLMEKFIQHLTSPQVKRLGFEKRLQDTHEDTLLRGLVLRTAGRYGNENVQIKALRSFRQGIRKNLSNIHPDIRTAVYDTVAKVGGQPEFNYFKRLYTETDLQEEKNRIGRAMCLFPSYVLVEKALEFSLSRFVRSQDAWRFVHAGASHSSGRVTVWQFVKQHWDKYLNLYGHGGHLLSRTIEALSHYDDNAISKQINQFFQTHPHPGADRTLYQVLEQIQSNAAWKKTAAREVEVFLINRKV